MCVVSLVFTFGFVFYLFATVFNLFTCFILVPPLQIVVISPFIYLYLFPFAFVLPLSSFCKIRGMDMSPMTVFISLIVRSGC